MPVYAHAPLMDRVVRGVEEPPYFVFRDHIFTQRSTEKPPVLLESREDSGVRNLVSLTESVSQPRSQLTYW